MAERDSWATMNGAPPAGRIVDVEDARIATSALIVPGPSLVNSRNGFRPGPGTGGLVTATGTPDKNVNVAAFQYFMRASRGLGSYIQTLDATKVLDILNATPAHGSLTRFDLIVAQQSDTHYSDPSTGFWVGRILGTPSGTPVDPAVTTANGAPTNSPDYFVLARITVTGGMLTVGPAAIDTSMRPGFTTGLGGLLGISNVTERGNISAPPYDGFPIYRKDRDWTEIYDGAAWRAQGIPWGTSLADLTAAVTNPYTGQLGLTTDTNLMYRWNGSAWKIAFGIGGGGAATRQSARYLNTNSPTTTIASGADVTATFPTAQRACDLVVASGTNNTTFTLQKAGVWRISTGIRGTVGTTGMECRICTSPQTTLSNTLVNGPAGTLSTSATVEKHFAALTAIQVGWFQTSGSNKNPDAGFGEATHVSFAYLGQED